MTAVAVLPRGWRGRGLDFGLTAIFAACAALAVSYTLGRSAAFAFAIPAIALLFYMGRNWRMGVALLFVVSSLDGLLKHLHPSLATYIVKDASVLAIYAGALIPVLLRKVTLPLQRSALIATWLLFGAYFIANGIRDGDGTLQAIAGFRQHLFFSGLMFVGALAYVRGTKFSWYVDVAIGCITLAAVVGIVQYQMGDTWLALSPNFTKLGLHYRTAETNTGGVAIHYYRAFGSLADPAAMGNATAYGCALALASFGRWNRRSRWIGSAALLLMFSALILSAARTSMLGLAIGGLAVLFLTVRLENRKRVAAAVVAVIVGVVIVGALAGRTLAVRFDSSSSSSAATSRIDAAETMVTRMREQPLGFGLGSSGAGGNFSNTLEAKTKDELLLDNLYLSYLYEGGPAGLLLFVLLQGVILVATIRRVRSAQDAATRSLFTAMAGGQLAVLASGFANGGVFDYAPVCQIFWFLCGGLLVDERLLNARA
ncbi:MAG: O-antigen ligase family protein [Candidatus Eremiobacteraeota bacterium]|nr:O-antigen ligase family protein [Candidatus Eremiobacteraeota bacterium]